MSRSRRKQVTAALVLVGVAVLMTSYLRGTVVVDVPFEPSSSDEGVRCEIVRWPGESDTDPVVRCAGVFDRSIDALWEPLTDYERLPEAYDNVFYNYQVESLSGAAPGPVELEGVVRFWLMRFPLDTTLEHGLEPEGLRTVSWASEVPRFTTRGGWRLEVLDEGQTRVEYLIDARVSVLPGFLVRVLMRDNLARMVSSLEDVAE